MKNYILIQNISFLKKKNMRNVRLKKHENLFDVFMDPHFSRAFPLDGDTRFPFFLYLKNHLKEIAFGVATYFSYFFKGKIK